MERYADLFKKHVINFKLRLCCYMAPVRTGLLTLTYINIAIGYMTLMFYVEESFQPLLLKALEGINGDPPNYGPSCLIVYAVELGSNVLLLCGMIRNDLVLLRAYLYFALGVLMAAAMTYSVMFTAQTAVVKFLIIASIGYQIYMILLVRSAMVEITQSAVKNDYKVNYRRQSSVRYSRPGYRDQFCVVIEPYGYRPRRSLVPMVTYTSTTPKVTKEIAKDEPVKERSAVTIHSPAKQGNVKGTTKEGAANEGAAKEGAAKEAKEEVAKESKEKETVKRKRSIFGKKVKAKKDESTATKPEN